MDGEEKKDLISNLDEEIKAKILSYLPIKEAIQTSKLSWKWRYTWTAISELEIREDYFTSIKLPESRSRLVKFVDILFLFHKGPIRKFKLSTKECCHDALHRWTLNLSRNGISELALELSCKWKKYKLHSSFFSCKDLSSIYLCNCFINLPQDYEGFKMLSVLKLENCSLSGVVIDRLVCKCPLLKDLSLTRFRDGSAIRIDAPNIERLKIDGNFTDLQLLTPKLVRACVGLEGYVKNSWPKGGHRNNFSRAFSGVSEIRMLGIHRHFLKYLAQGNLLKENQLSIIFSHLKVLALDIDLSNSEEIMAASLLLQNAPILKDLDVVVSKSSKEKDRSLPTDIALSIYFQHLKTVLVADFVPTELDLELVRLVIIAPLLETLTISSEKPEYNTPVTVDQLNQFPEASANVRITQL